MKNVKNKAVKNLDPRTGRIRQLEAENKKLRLLVAEYKRLMMEICWRMMMTMVMKMMIGMMIVYCRKVQVKVCVILRTFKTFFTTKCFYEKKCVTKIFLLKLRASYIILINQVNYEYI